MQFKVEWEEEVWRNRRKTVDVSDDELAACFLEKAKILLNMDKPEHGGSAWAREWAWFFDNSCVRLWGYPRWDKEPFYREMCKSAWFRGEMERILEQHAKGPLPRYETISRYIEENVAQMLIEHPTTAGLYGQYCERCGELERLFRPHIGG